MTSLAQMTSFGFFLLVKQAVFDSTELLPLHQDILGEYQIMMIHNEANAAVFNDQIYVHMNPDNNQVHWLLQSFLINCFHALLKNSMK